MGVVEETQVIENKLFAIPQESLELNRDDYILRADKSVFEGSEGYDKEKISLTRDELANVYKRCGVNPIGSEHYGKENNFETHT